MEEVKFWKSKYTGSNQGDSQASEEELTLLRTDNQNLIRDIRLKEDQINDLKRRMDLMVKEIEEITYQNDVKNENLLRHIQHLEHLLSLNNINFPDINQIY